MIMPRGLRRFCEILSAALVSAFGFLLVPGSWEFTVSGSTQTSPVLQVQMQYVFGCFMFFPVLLGVFGLIKFINILLNVPVAVQQLNLRQRVDSWELQFSLARSSCALSLGACRYLSWHFVCRLPHLLCGHTARRFPTKNLCRRRLVRPALGIPGFIMAGSLMNGGGITDRIIRFASAGVGWIRGGLGLTNVAGSMLFAGISGTAVAEAASIGAVMIPGMKKEGYPIESCGRYHRRCIDGGPQGILQRHYAPTFKMLELYDVEEVYARAASLGRTWSNGRGSADRPRGQY